MMSNVTFKDREKERAYRAYKRAQRRKRVIRNRIIAGVGVFVLVAGVVLTVKACNDRNVNPTEASTISTAERETFTTATPEPTEEPTEAYIEDDNYIYPYNTMSADWGSEIYEEGFRYYEIPESFKLEGGCLPEVAQVYLYSLCKEKGIDYYIMLALIERESRYMYDATGDSGSSKGYMQIQEKWHTELMEAEGVTDLYNPYQNFRVGTTIFKGISEDYLVSSGIHCVLMVYNAGESGAKKMWKQGIYSTEYSRAIVKRAQEIKQDLEDK